jgi:hypothetical protein
MKRWLKYVLFGGHHMGFVPHLVEFGFKFSVLLKIYANYMKRWLKYVLFGGHQICFSFPSCIELSLKLKVSPKLIKYAFFLLYVGLYHLCIMHPCPK